MIEKIDLLELPRIFKNQLIFAVILILGSILKDGFSLIFFFFIIYYTLKGNNYVTIYLWLIWYFLFGFFMTQRLITNNSILILTKPKYLLLVFIFMKLILNVESLFYKLTLFRQSVVLIIVSTLGSVLNFQLPVANLQIISFVLLFLIILKVKLSLGQYKSIFNLVVSIGIFQTLISFLQLTSVISPMKGIMEDGTGGTTEWTAGLDDVAMGTFQGSHIVSWFQSLIFIILLQFWFFNRKFKYLAVGFFCIIQFSFTDSKIVLGVTIVMIFIILFNYLKHLKLSLNTKINYLLSISLLLFFLILGWDMYYKYYSANTGSDYRTDLNTVYSNEMSTTIITIGNNFLSWGKINGFISIAIDFFSNGLKFVFLGYGYQGFNVNDKLGEILSKDLAIMQVNSLTNSYSGLITHFATLGFLGFYLWLKLIRQFYKFNNRVSKVYKSFLINNFFRVYLMFSFVVCFLYTINFTQIPIVSFFLVYALLIKISFLTCES